MNEEHLVRQTMTQNLSIQHSETDLQDPVHPDERNDGEEKAAAVGRKAPVESESVEAGDAADTGNTLEAGNADESGEGGALSEGKPAALEEKPSFKPAPHQLIKALLFSTPEYLSVGKLKELLEEDWDAKKIRQVVREINEEFRETREPYEVAEANNSFRMRTRPEYFYWVKKLFKDSGSRRLSQAALEILSIVAYKQPITKAEIEAIRGVSVDGTIKGLLDRKLIAILGKSESIGGAFEYGTTKDFMMYFGINNINQDLPKLSEFEELVQSSSLLPQVDRDGELVEREQSDVEEEPGEEKESGGEEDLSSRKEAGSGPEDDSNSQIDG